jgi:hypothetical protein
VPHWQICSRSDYLSLRTPLNLVFFFWAMNWPPSLFRFVKIFSIVLVASCERVFLTSATPSGLFVAMCAPLLLLFWLALANDLEAHAGGAQAGSSQVIGLG